MWCVARWEGRWERLERVRGGEGKPRIGSRKHADVDETGLERGRVVKQRWALIEAEGCRGTGGLTTRRGCTGTASKAGWHRSGGQIVREDVGAEHVSIEPHLGLSDKERPSVGSGASGRPQPPATAPREWPL